MYDAKTNEVGEEVMRKLERYFLLRVVDAKWMDHIDNMDRLKQGITLRAYGQRDPVIEYKEEGYEMYEEMLGAIGEDVVKLMFRVQLNTNTEAKESGMTMVEGNGEPKKRVTTVRKEAKIGRNDPCPCGSGKKYKKCCGMNE